MNAAIYMGNI